MSYPDLCGDRTQYHNHPDPPQLRWTILRVGSEVISPQLDGQDPGHSWWSLYLPERPDMGLDLDHGTFAMGCDRLTFIPPWMPFRYRFGPDMGHAYIHFTVEQIPGALIRQLFTRPLAIRDAEALGRMRSLAIDVGHERQTDPSVVSLRAGIVVALCLPPIVDSLAPEDRELLFSREEHWGRLDPALRYVHRNMHRQIAVADLAEELEVSEKHCTRLFRHHLGQTPVQFITEQRLQRAAELLLSSDWSLDRVAHYCGFPTAQYLSRQFRRQHGMPPGSWRLRYGGRPM